MSDTTPIPPPKVPAKVPSAKGYHYWHSHGANRAEQGDVAPMPAHVVLKTEARAAPMEAPPTAITKYSWCNNEKSVSVYVDFEGVSAENCTVTFTKHHLKVEITTDKRNLLNLHLAKSISGEASSFRFKPNQLVLKLVKGDDKVTWFDLVAKPGAADSASDDE